MPLTNSLKMGPFRTTDEDPGLSSLVKGEAFLRPSELFGTAPSISP